jgi:glycosyltransferase involved in cell wall biosynthesis
MTTTAAGSATPDTAGEAERLRVLWLTETYPPSRGGMAESCDRIVRGLRRRGVTVDVLHFIARTRARAWTIETQAGGRYLACPLDDDPAYALNRAWSALESDGRTRSVTHVVAFGGSRPIAAAPVYAAWLGVPLITLIRGNDFDASVFSTRRRPILDEAITRSALVCAVSRDKAQKIAALYPGTRVRWIPNGIDRGDWTLIPSDLEKATRWRMNTLADRRTRVLGLFGQLKAKKGAIFLLDALRHSGLAGALHLVLAGWTPPELEAWLDEHPGELGVTQLPFQDRYELLPWYAACDWVVIPSFFDGMPNVLVEAAALGIPLIAARTGGMADVLEDGETALMFDPGDEAGCMWALSRAASVDDRRRAEMGAACRALVESELEAGLEAERYIDALAETAAVSR